jgi:phosphoribosylglycinamide formyltransferase-1
MFEIGWFSSGRDEAARDLLQVVFDEIQSGSIKGRISFVFVSRDRSEKPESDEFIRLAESFGLDVVCLSHRGFEPEMRKAGLRESRELGEDSPLLIDWRRKYDEQVMAMLAGYRADLIVLAGYMLILSPDMCQEYDMINLHPALPGGPKGTWQEVVWQLLEEEAEKTGVMMHLIIPELDAGPAITYCEFSISDDEIQSLRDQWRAKRRERSLKEIQKSEGEDEPLFREIRRRGLMREFPLIVATLKAAASGEFSIVNGEVIAGGRKLVRGFDLTEEIERAIECDE